MPPLLPWRQAGALALTVSHRLIELKPLSLVWKASYWDVILVRSYITDLRLEDRRAKHPPAD